MYKRFFRKEQILTIPNLLSLVRLMLIPLILWLYLEKEQRFAAAIVVVLSGITDMADGIIARKFNMISDFGKILDPVADKLTQLSLLCCFVTKNKWVTPLLVLFVIKEMLMLVCGYLGLKHRDQVNGSQWFGKLSTAVFYAVMLVFFVFENIPYGLMSALLWLCGICLGLSLVKYLIYYNRLLFSLREEGSA